MSFKKLTIIILSLCLILVQAILNTSDVVQAAQTTSKSITNPQNITTTAKVTSNPQPFIKITKVIAEKTGMQPLGTSLRFSASASGSNLQYKWYIYKNNKLIYTSPYMNSNILVWIPSDLGVYNAKVSIKSGSIEVFSNYTSECNIILDFNYLVKPFKVIALSNSNTYLYKSASTSKKSSNIKKGDKLEIIKDVDGLWYNVKSLSNNTTGWIKKSYIIIPNDTAANTFNMKKEYLEMYVNKNNFSSKTKYFIWVDLDRQQVHIFTGKKNSWKLLKSFTCASGKNSAPTVRGQFTITGRGPLLISASNPDVRARTKVRIFKSYYFHSILYNANGQVIDGRLGQRLSHGCIRVSTEDAKWIYDNIKDGTKVFIN